MTTFSFLYFLNRWGSKILKKKYKRERNLCWEALIKHRIFDKMLVLWLKLQIMCVFTLCDIQCFMPRASDFQLLSCHHHLYCPRGGVWFLASVASQSDRSGDNKPFGVWSKCASMWKRKRKQYRDEKLRSREALSQHYLQCRILIGAHSNLRLEDNLIT